MPRKQQTPLERCLFPSSDTLEVGIDEAGRGPLFGRVYAAAVILPKDDSFPHELMKDSKRFTSRKKLAEAAEIVMEKAIAYSVQFAENTDVDELNPLKATMRIMNRAVTEVMEKVNSSGDNIHLLVDGSYFTQTPRVNKTGGIVYLPYTCVTSGDNTYTSIAAASILAKHHRDSYVDEMCDLHPGLDALYDLRKNKGYGTASHLKAIETYGITKWHRRTFGKCRDAPVIEIEIGED
jgi:ribonuclease HII